MADRDDMALPIGCSCADCSHYRKCVVLIGPDHINEQARRCDWSPSRFSLVVPPRGESGVPSGEPK